MALQPKFQPCLYTLAIDPTSVANCKLKDSQMLEIPFIQWNGFVIFLTNILLPLSKQFPLLFPLPLRNEGEERTVRSFVDSRRDYVYSFPLPLRNVISVRTQNSIIDRDAERSGKKRRQEGTEDKNQHLRSREKKGEGLGRHGTGQP